MNDIRPSVSTLEEASILLDGHHILRPGTPEYEQYYVPRPKIESNLIRESIRAKRADRPFDWFFTGHTGSGKSTELNRIITDEQITKEYLPIYIDLESDFDIHNIKYTDLILAMAKGCATEADKNKVALSKDLETRIERWGANIVKEDENKTATEGKAWLKLSLPFFGLSEEVRSGGTKREIVRQEISENIVSFIRLIDELAEAISQKTECRVLCVLDGMDHVDTGPCYDLLNNHLQTIKLPKISKIIVIPLALLNSQFLATIGKDFSTVPNIKVFTSPGSGLIIDEEGFSFYKEVISRYVSLNHFDEESLNSLFKLSAGIVRDMIRNTGDACGYAVEAGLQRVGIDQVERVWNETIRYYRSQLQAQDYAVLNKVQENPQIEGIDGVPQLLHSKAVVFYPNGEGWYGVHPAIQRMMGIV